MPTTIGTAWVDIKPSLNGVKSDIQRQLRGTGTQISSSLGKEITKSAIIGTAVGGAILEGVKKVSGKVAKTVGDMMSAATGEMDAVIRASSALGKMGYGMGDVNKKIAQLRENANKTAAKMGDLTDGFLNLTASWKDMDLTANATQALSDAILSFGGTPEMVANAITQISQVDLDGPLDAQTWLSLRNSGLIPVLGTLAEMNGMSLGEFKKSLGLGVLSTRDLVNGLIQLDQQGTSTGASLEEIAKSNAAATWSGSWDTAKNTVISSISEQLQTLWTLRGAGTKIIEMGDSLAETISNAGKRIQEFGAWCASSAPQVELMKTGLVGISSALGVIAGINIAKTVGSSLPGVITKVKTLGSSIAQIVASGHPIVALIVGATAALGYFFTQTETGQGIIKGAISWITETAIPAIQGFVAGVLEKIAPVLEKIGGAISTVVTKVIEFVGSIDIVGTLGPIIDAVLGAIGTAFEVIGAVLQQVAPILESVFKAIGEFVSAVAPIFASVLDAVASVLSAIIEPLMPLVSAFGDLFKAIIKLNVALGKLVVALLRPLFAIIKGVAKIVLTVVKAVVTLVSAALKPLAAILKVVIGVIALIATFITGVLVGVLETVINIISGIVSFIAGAIEKVVSVVMAIASVVLPIIIGALTAITEVVTNVVGGIVGFISSVITTISGYIQNIANFINFIVNGIAEFITGVVTVVSDVVTGVIEFIVAGITMFAEIVNGIISGIVNFIISLITGVVNFITGVIDGITAAVNWFANVVNAIWSGIVNAIHRVFGPIVQWFKTVFTNVWNGIKGCFAGVTQFFSGVWTNIKNAFSGVFNLGKNIAQGLVNGITSAADWVISKIKGFCNNALGAVKNFFGIHSPSKVMAQMGRYIDQGLVNGIDDEADSVAKAMRDMGDVALSEMSAIDSQLSAGFKSSVDVAAYQDNTAPSRVIQNNNITIKESFDLKLAESKLGYAVAMA